MISMISPDGSWFELVVSHVTGNILRRDFAKFIMEVVSIVIFLVVAG